MRISPKPIVIATAPRPQPYTGQATCLLHLPPHHPYPPPSSTLLLPLPLLLPLLSCISSLLSKFCALFVLTSASCALCTSGNRLGAPASCPTHLTIGNLHRLSQTPSEHSLLGSSAAHMCALSALRTFQAFGMKALAQHSWTSALTCEVPTLRASALCCLVTQHDRAL
ncbi:hypothetical protein F4782DRAFT_439519 [Xylaria castorea]|nr:hypothetical protein F4782DRAFT_439519 [Xylaria castorea]